MSKIISMCKKTWQWISTNGAEISKRKLQMSAMRTKTGQKGHLSGAQGLAKI